MIKRHRGKIHIQGIGTDIVGVTPRMIALLKKRYEFKAISDVDDIAEEVDFILNDTPHCSEYSKLYIVREIVINTLFGSLEKAVVKLLKNYFKKAIEDYIDRNLQPYIYNGVKYYKKID